MPNNERRLSARDAVGNIDRYSVRTVSIFVQVAPANATGRDPDAHVVRPEYHPRVRLQFDRARPLPYSRGEMGIAHANHLTGRER